MGAPKARVTTETGNVVAGCRRTPARSWGCHAFSKTDFHVMNFMLTEAQIDAQSSLLFNRRGLLPDRRWVMTNISTSAGFCFRGLTKETSPFFWFRVLALLKQQQMYKKKPQTDKLLRASVVSSDSIEAKAGEGVIREVVVHWNFIYSWTWQPVRFSVFFLLLILSGLTSSWFFINEAHSSVKFYLSSPEKLNRQLSLHLSSLHTVVLTCCQFVHFESRKVEWSICQIELEELFGKNL